MEILQRKYNTERGAESKYCWDLLRWHLCSAMSYCDVQFPLPTGVGKAGKSREQSQWHLLPTLPPSSSPLLLILSLEEIGDYFFVVVFKSYFPSSWCDLKRTDRLRSSPRPSSPLQMKQKWEIPATLIWISRSESLILEIWIVKGEGENGNPVARLKKQKRRQWKLTNPEEQRSKFKGRSCVCLIKGNIPLFFFLRVTSLIHGPNKLLLCSRDVHMLLSTI